MIENVFSCQVIVNYQCDMRYLFFEVISKSSYFKKRKTSDVLSLTIIKTPEMDYNPKGTRFFFPNLQVFNCILCKIYTLEKEDFEQFPKLIALELEENYIIYLPGDLFKNRASIQVVNLNKNLIKSIEKGLFEPAKNLVGFDFAEIICHPDKNEYPIEEITNRVEKACRDASRSVKVKNKNKLTRRDKQVFQCAKDFIMREDLEEMNNKV